MDAAGKFENLKGGGEVCEMCHNEVYVQLLGTVRVGNQTYERGAAPCKWCQLGLRAYTRLIRGASPATKELWDSYGLDDVEYAYPADAAVLPVADQRAALKLARETMASARRVP
jgi:hypothetical protein